jgi:tetratricopeptide (TPR) repeat protein
MANSPVSGHDTSGLGPVLDLLGKMENQVGSMSNGRPSEQNPSPGAADDELRTLREELLSADQRGYEQLARFTQALEDLKHAIPSLIDETVNSRFLEIEDTFHRNVKEIHSRSIESFTQSVQSKIGQRIAALENNLSVHTEAMGQLREHYLKTDRNVQRLMSGLDRLTAELMRLSTSASPNLPRTIYVPGATRLERPDRMERADRYDPRALSQDGASSAAETEPAPAEAVKRPVRRKIRRPSRVLIPLAMAIVLVPVGLLTWQLRSGSDSATFRKNETPPSAAAELTGTAAQLRMAADFAVQKDYAKAENIYRLVIKSEPNNREAIKELASVLFRQQRYEESAAVLKTLPPE